MAVIDDNFYDADSISSLKGADPYRKKPSTVLGTDDENGALHAIWEVVTNATDEDREVGSDRTIIRYSKDGVVEVQDFGRGVPMAWNDKEKKYAYELIFCTMYASGKYDNKHYKRSAGLNGVGDTAAQFTSEFMDVVSVRDERENIRKDAKGNLKYDIVRTRYEMHFVKGYAASKLKVERNVTEHTGTWIRFKPDREVFKSASSVIFPIEVFLDRLRRDAMLLPGSKFELQYEGFKNNVIVFDGGAAEWLDKVTPDRFTKEFINNHMEGEGRDDEENMSKLYWASSEVTFGFGRKDAIVEVYHNGNILPEGGASLEGFKEAITNVINEYARQNDKVSKGDKYTSKDIENLIVGVVSTYCAGDDTSYTHQTKVAINNKYIKRLTKEVTTKAFKEWTFSHKTEMDRLIKEVEANKAIRIEGEKLTKTLLKNLTKDVNNFKDTVKKLTRCLSKNPEECELYIVEGDSAKGPITLARDAKTQAVLPLRGKTINPIKESIKTVLKSQVVIDILRCLGCGVEAKLKDVEGIPEFDESKLRYHKIIICTDADDDGFHIRCLVLALLYVLVPTLIKKGYVYIAETPLFLIKIPDGRKYRTYYAYTNKEKDKMLEQLRAEGYKDKDLVVQRLKGLGETDASVMNKTTMNKENRHLIRVKINNQNEFNTLMESLMGKDVESRRGLIETYFNEDFGDIDYSDAEEISDDNTIDLSSLSAFNNF